MRGDRCGNSRGSRRFNIVVVPVGDRVSYNSHGWEIVVPTVMMVVVVMLMVIGAIVVMFAKAWA